MFCNNTKKRKKIKEIYKNGFCIVGLTCILFVIHGCAAMKLRPEFIPLRSLPPEAVKITPPNEIEIMTDAPQTGKQYIELGYITVDETKVFPFRTLSTSEKDIIEMVREEAAEHGADAVIKFHISGEHPARIAKGIAIIYKKYGYNEP